MFRLTWKNSLAQLPSWEQGRCKWWSASLCGAAASRWEWNPLWAAAAASPAGPEGRRGQRRACRTGHGAQQSKNTTERERFTGEKQVKENRTVEIKFKSESKSWLNVGGSRFAWLKGYSPVWAFVENSIVPQNLTLWPQELPPENGVDGHCKSCAIQRK